MIIFFAEVYYRANISPKQYQSELERQLRKTTLGISVGMVKTFKDDTNVRFDPYGHFGQAFQSNDFENNINQYKICEIKPPSVEKVHKYYLLYTEKLICSFFSLVK